MSRPIEFATVTTSINELTRGMWAAIKPMLDSLSDEEIEKMPSILSEPSVKEAAERYGINDIIDRNGKWIYIYFLGGYLMKGETTLHNYDD